MKLTADKKDLNAAMKRATKIAPKKASSPILSHVALDFDGESVTITANDGSQTFSQRVPAEGESGQLTVEAEKLAKAVNGMKDGPIEIGEGYIKQGRSRLKLENLDYDHFPLPDYDECTPISNSAAVIESMDTVQHAMAIKDVRYYLMGLYLSEGYTVATDGHRMTFVDSGYDGPHAIIPGDAVRQIISMDGTISMSDRQIIVDDGMARFSSKLVEGKYPDWQRVIPKEPEGSVGFDRDELIAALKTAQLGGDMVKISFDATNATFENDGAHTECDCSSEIEGEVAFKAQYMIDALIKCDESVVMQYSGASSPVFINDFAVVMPVRM